MKIRFRGLATAAALLMPLGCDSSNDEPSGLRTGSYRFSTTSVADGCDAGTLAADYDGETVQIRSVSDTTVVFERNDGPIALPRAGDVIGGEQEMAGTFDYVNDYADFGLTQSYNCVEQDYLTMTLTITSDTTLDYDELLTYTAVSGSASDCIAANSSAYAQVLTSFPCETTVGSTLKRD